MTGSTEEIEQQIRTDYNIRPGPYLRGLTPPAYPEYSHNLIREWLWSLGVARDKTATMRNQGLENAYCAGREWVRQNLSADKPFTPGRQFRRPPGVKGLKFNDEGGFKPGEIIGLLEGQEPKKPDIVFDSLPDNTGRDEKPISPQPIDAQAIAKAADAVISKRLVEAEQRLQRMIGGQVKGEVAQQIKSEMEKIRVAISEETKTKLSEIAKAAAEEATIRLIEERVPRRLEIITPKGVKRLDAEPRHEAFERILFWLSLKRHVYIVGPHGTGKTHLFRQLSSALDLRYFPIGQTLTKYELSGHKGPTGEYIGTLLREAIETGGFVGIDEGDTWAAAAMVFLNTPLANGYCSFPDKVVEVHPDFICCIAANTWGHGATMQYQGRNPLDAASLDRFAFEEVDYDENLEIQLYGDTPWTQYCHRVRKIARELRIYEAAPSMRGIEMGNLALDAKGNPELIQKSVLWKGLAPDTVAKIKAQAGTFGKVNNIREVA